MAMMNEMEYRTIGSALAGGYRAAVYCRLSKDDELQGESASIANQRDMLEKYCEKQGWEVVAVYQDDGFTGLNMERPDLQRMLRSIERRQINLVITKDLSRLGRNYLQTGHLITPPGKERRHWGRVLHTMAAATQAPEVVSKVRYQTMAIWERVEPNSVMDWLRKTRNARRCQDGDGRFMVRRSGWRGEPYVGQGNQRPSAVLGAQTPAGEAGLCGRCQRHPPPERW